MGRLWFRLHKLCDARLPRPTGLPKIISTKIKNVPQLGGERILTGKRGG